MDSQVKRFRVLLALSSVALVVAVVALVLGLNGNIRTATAQTATQIPILGQLVPGVLGQTTVVQSEHVAGVTTNANLEDDLMNALAPDASAVLSGHDLTIQVGQDDGAGTIVGGDAAMISLPTPLPTATPMVPGALPTFIAPTAEIPTGGSDGQCLQRSGTGLAWGACGTGMGVTPTEVPTDFPFRMYGVFLRDPDETFLTAANFLNGSTEVNNYSTTQSYSVFFDWPSDDSNAVGTYSGADCSPNICVYPAMAVQVVPGRPNLLGSFSSLVSGFYYSGANVTINGDEYVTLIASGSAWYLAALTQSPQKYTWDAYTGTALAPIPNPN